MGSSCRASTSGPPCARCSREDVPATPRHFLHRLDERYHERRLGIRSEGIIELDSLGVGAPGYMAYCPTGYNALRRGLRLAKLRPGQDVYLDYGSGMGRALVFAAAFFDFRRVVGVEISEELNAAARENVRSATPLLRCRDIQIVTADATAYVPPPDATVLHFFNPFRGEALAAVLRNVRRSLEEAPRPITIIYDNDDDFERQTRGERWLVKRRAYRVYPDVSSGVYESTR